MGLMMTMSMVDDVVTTKVIPTRNRLWDRCRVSLRVIVAASDRSPGPRCLVIS